MQFKTGDIGSVHHDFSFHWKRLAQACIRFITRSHWDHTFIVWKDEQGVLWAVEAQFGNGIDKVPLEDYLSSKRCSIAFTRRVIPIQEHIMSSFIKTFVGKGSKKYDNLALIQQMSYQVARRFKQGVKWFGRTDNGKASDRFYCSEFASFCHDLEGWYKMTPEDLYKHKEFELIWVKA